eukprot:TRINITY_DN20863_c0_g1_i1.p1 TRINITY_DN20863_c0_g1~~TRINITY_DN20863_c0_g1_i1.p1  ORF type:complete len:360 (-),score=66.51 TRINITY_DN20863_c0_g1_i1:250-1197(-)
MDAIFVAAGDLDGSTLLNSVEILTKDDNGVFTSKQMDVGGCSSITPFPIATSNGVGAFFNGLPHACVGYKKGQQSPKCYYFSKEGKWNTNFDLTTSLNNGDGSSVVFGDWGVIQTPWWIVGGETSGKGTELWGGNPPAEITNDPITLPQVLNQACIVKISNDEAFVIAVPQLIESPTNMAWTYKLSSNTWTKVTDTREQRFGAACGYIKNTAGRFVVLAGGTRSSTTEIFDLSTNTWTTGPDLGENIQKGRMVSVNNGEEVLFIGGYNGEKRKALTAIRRMGSSMNSWETVGNLGTARFDHVAFAVPAGNLPALC